jgi:hypothetical protein
MATGNQIVTIGNVLYRKGIGFNACGKLSNLAEPLSVREASKVIDYLIKEGVKDLDLFKDGEVKDEFANPNVWTDLLAKI